MQTFQIFQNPEWTKRTTYLKYSRLMGCQVFYEIEKKCRNFYFFIFVEFFFTVFLLCKYYTLHWSFFLSLSSDPSMETTPIGKPSFSYSGKLPSLFLKRSIEKKRKKLALKFSLNTLWECWVFDVILTDYNNFFTIRFQRVYFMPN